MHVAPTTSTAGLRGSRARDWEAIGQTLIGITCFSLTFPMTRWALSSFDPTEIALIRGTVAGCMAGVFLLLSKAKVPENRLIGRMFGAALGIVLIFPLLISISLQFVPATHAAVLAGILPLFTAMFGVWRGRESSRLSFWIFALLGTLLLLGFSAWRTHFNRIEPADLLILVAYFACAYGYAEGALVAREVGSWPAICWILLVILPLELPALLGWLSIHGWLPRSPQLTAWIGLTYLSVVSQWLGFFFYYRGLALGGVVRMSQLQLLLPLLSILASGVILGEQIEPMTLLVAALIGVIVYAGRQSVGN